jgi:hypothetical protein
MFCTLQEAAQTLNTSEDRIKDLLEKGLLHEFRQGPHCLLKEAEVGALALQQRQRRESSSPDALPTWDGRPPSARAGSRPPQVPGPWPAPDPQGRSAAGLRVGGHSEKEHHGRSACGHAGRPYTDRRVAYPRRAEEKTPRRPDRLSVPQWFWMGLVQDRPVAIALLAGLVLSLLAALVAGLCYLAHVS